MPTFIHGKGTKTYIDEFDLSDYFNAADSTFAIETADISAFGASSRSFLPGLQTATMGLTGLWSQDATTGSDVVLEALLANATSPLTTVAIAAGTIGNKAILMQSDELTYNISSPVADVVSVSADFQATTDGTSNLTYSGQSGVQLTPYLTATTLDFPASFTSVDNAASTANGGFAIIHVPINTMSGGVTTYKVQHSANDVSWADRITCSPVAATTTTSELKAVSGTVNRYIRCSGTTAASSGALTTMVSFARF